MPCASSPDQHWQEVLGRLADKDLRRQLRLSPVAAAGGGVINMASNDYLGLAGEARMVVAAREALDRWGVGAGASRLVTGHLPPHEALEGELAAFKKAEAALVFTSGYAANVGVLTALAGPRDMILLDRLNHASLIDGARQSGATTRLYRHADLDHLEHLLEASSGERGRRFIVTDGVFSMDGELAPLPELVELAGRYEALLVVDDAHATGVVGPKGRGTPAYFGLEEEVPVRIGTLSKALGAQGGFVAGSRALIDLLINKARSFIYSTGIAPAVAAAAREALHIAEAEDTRRRRLQAHLEALREGLRAKGYTVIGEAPAPMLAVKLGDPATAVEAAGRLAEAGVCAPAIRPPTVPKGTSRIRLAPMATHSESDIQRVLEAF